MLDVLGFRAHGRYKQDAYQRQSAQERPRRHGKEALPLRLLRPACPPVALRRLCLATQEPIQLIDITDAVAAQVRAIGQREGLVTIFSRHTTAAIRIQEDEPLLRQDLCDFLARCAPRQAYYRHNDFEIRTEHMHPDESPNGHSHCLQLLLGSSETVPVSEGKLQLGTWQRLFLVELDGPRPDREVLLQLLSVEA
jgi:secondary thiamine-phosphate synthase enzyme